MPEGWEWDETLYAGSAEYYERGRLPYPSGLAAVAEAALGLDGTGRLLDVGCGPGIIGLRLAPLVAEAVGVDADPQMVEHAARRATELRITNTRWICGRAEDLPAMLGRFQVATFGQSFHWMDRARVATAMRAVLEPGGAFVLVHHWSIDSDPAPESTRPKPPHAAVLQLVEAYLGSTRRAGQGVLRHGTPDNEDAVLRDAGFAASERHDVPGGDVVVTDVDDQVARVFSMSRSAPHLFGTRLRAFEADLRALLDATTEDGRFAECVRDAAIEVWRSP
jgi:ubiquinone/menaquinone biosynthesis C-methylase UbiE